MIIQCGLFQHIYHIGCAFNLHSIINNGLIPGGQDSSKRQTVFFLPIDPRDKEHQDPAHIDFSVPRRAQYLHNAWKKHQDAVFWVDIDLAIRKGLTFYQTRSNAIILQGTLPAYCIPKVVRLKTGEVLYEKSYMSPRPPPKISLRHDHDWTRRNNELCSTVEQQPVGKIVRLFCGGVQRATFSQLTQPKPIPICDRSGKPDSTEDVFVVKGETSRSHEIDEKRLHEELGSSDRSGKPDNLSENTRVEQTHDGSGQLDERNSSSAHTGKEQFAPEENRDIALFNTDNEFNRAINEEDIDFNIPGQPHSAVKQSHGANVQILIQKIENHPHRHALQSDLQQRQQFDGSGQPDGERNVDQSVNFGVTRFSEDIQTVRMVDRSGQPDERNSSSAHTVKEQFAPEENRDIALFNTDNEFNRAINEEDIDFNIPGQPHSAVKQSHGANVQILIQKIENHPHRHALQSDLQQRQQFDGPGQLDGERNVDQSVNFGVTRFSEDIQTVRMVDRSGQPDERNSSNAQIRTLLEEQRETIIEEYREKVSHHELHAAHAEEERRLLQGQLWLQKLEFREAHQQSLTEMEELRKFQSTFDTIARRKLIEDQNTILELSGRIQELQNEVNCMNVSEDFQDAESVRSGNSHVTSRPVSFPPHPIPEGMLRHSFVSPCRREGPPSIWDTHGISGNVFADPPTSSSVPYPQELHQWNSSIEEPLHSSTVEKSERPEQNQDLRCQSGPSAKDSVIFSGGDSSKKYGADQQRLFTLTSSLHQRHLLAGR